MSREGIIFVSLFFIANLVHFIYERHLINQMDEMNEDWYEFCEKQIDNLVGSYNRIIKKYKEQLRRYEEISRAERTQTLGSQK